MSHRAVAGGASIRPLAVVVIIGALLAAWIAWRANPGASRPTRAAQECKVRYAQAPTFRDSVKVDASYPTEYSQHFYDVSGPATCGELRHEGLLP
jgi:hypothetical protein